MNDAANEAQVPVAAPVSTDISAVLAVMVAVFVGMTIVPPLTTLTPFVSAFPLRTRVDNAPMTEEPVAVIP